MTIWTIPNLVSFARLLGVPLLIWLGWNGGSDLAILLVFIVASITDWLDGWLARRLHQYSELGAQLDPIADRLYIVASLVLLLKRELVPAWVVGLIVLREISMGLLLLWMRSDGYAPPAVHYLGKAGTMMLLWSIPLLFLAALDWNGQAIVRAFAHGFLAWGVVTYWSAGILYLRQFLEARND